MTLTGVNQKITKLATKVKNVSMLEALHVSFTNTLRFGPSVNIHFESPSKLCDVCNVPYDLVGKMETFNDDVKFFLASLNKTHVYDSMGDVDANSEMNIVSEIVQRTFKNMSKLMKNCEFCHAVLTRVWHAFKIRGFISDSVKFPIGGRMQCCRTSVNKFKSMALKAVRNSEHRDVRKLQREKYFLMAFRSVPLKYLKEFRATVISDCELFDYDCSPPEIFAGRKDGDEENNLFS